LVEWNHIGNISVGYSTGSFVDNRLVIFVAPNEKSIEGAFLEAISYRYELRDNPAMLFFDNGSVNCCR
jgi:hypothetical protein